MYRLDDYDGKHRLDCNLAVGSIELFLDSTEVPVCPECKSVLNRLIPAPKGYVTGTRNPVLYRTTKK